MDYQCSYYEIKLYTDEQGKWHWRQEGRIKMHGPFDDREQALDDALGPMEEEGEFEAVAA